MLQFTKGICSLNFTCPDTKLVILSLICFFPTAGIMHLKVLTDPSSGPQVESSWGGEGAKFERSSFWFHLNQWFRFLITSFLTFSTHWYGSHTLRCNCICLHLTLDLRQVCTNWLLRNLVLSHTFWKGEKCRYFLTQVKFHQSYWVTTSWNWICNLLQLCER